MTFREKLADWISGGRISDDAIALREMEKIIMRGRENLAKSINSRLDLEEALRQIAQSPGADSSNGTLRRVIRIAREALE